MRRKYVGMIMWMCMAWLCHAQTSNTSGDKLIGIWSLDSIGIIEVSADQKEMSVSYDYVKDIIFFAFDTIEFKANDTCVLKSRSGVAFAPYMVIKNDSLSIMDKYGEFLYHYSIEETLVLEGAFAGSDMFGDFVIYKAFMRYKPDDKWITGTIENE